MQRIGNESTVDIGLLSAVLKVRGAGERNRVRFKTSQNDLATAEVGLETERQGEVLASLPRPGPGAPIALALCGNPPHLSSPAHLPLVPEPLFSISSSAGSKRIISSPILARVWTILCCTLQPSGGSLPSLPMIRDLHW